MSIPQLIGATLDSVFMLFGGAVSLYFYKKSQMKIFILLGIIPILFGTFQMYEEYDKFTKEKIPSKKFLQSQLKDKSTLAKDDIDYISPSGYKILVPKGYSYTDFSTTAISLIAINETKASSISVSNFRMNDSITNMIKDIRNYSKEKNTTYETKEPTQVTYNGLTANIVDFEVTKPQGRMKGYLVYYQINQILYQITLACFKKEFLDINPEFNRVIASFSFDKQ